MTNERIVKALMAAAQALDPSVKASKGKSVKAASGPQIYIAHLGAYVAGTLKGDWISPSSDEDELWDQIRGAVGVTKGEDFEWAVHDYDGFPDLGEYPGAEAIAKVAGMLEDHDEEIVTAALSEGGGTDDAAKMLEDGYAVYDSEEEYGQQLVDDLGQDNIKNIEWYIDIDMLARDLRHDDNIVYVNGAPFAFHR